MRHLLALVLTCFIVHHAAAQVAAPGAAEQAAADAAEGAAPDPYSTLFLTWFSDPTTTVVVQWLAQTPVEQSDQDGDEASSTPHPEATLRCTPAEAPDADPQTATAQPRRFGKAKRGTQWLVMRAQFSGLAPDTRYHLHLPGREEPLLFATTPARLDKPLVFAEGGDCGTYEETWMLHRQAAAWDPLFAVIGGDIAYADGHDVKKWATFLRGWRQHMVAPDGRLIPMIVTIGNHEARGGFGRGRGDAPLYYTLFDGLFPETGYAALDVNADLSFLLLDSNHTTRIPGAQTDWLKQALDERKDTRFLVPIYHVPMYPVYRPITGGARGDARMKQREHWLPLFDQHQLPLAFEHDDHVYKRTHPLRDGQVAEEGTVYLGDGAWGKLRERAVSPDRHPYLAAAATRRHVMRITLYPAKSDRVFDMLAVDEHGEEIDRYPAAEEPGE